MDNNNHSFLQGYYINDVFIVTAVKKVWIMLELSPSCSAFHDWKSLEFATFLD